MGYLVIECNEVLRYKEPHEHGCITTEDRVFLTHKGLNDNEGPGLQDVLPEAERDASKVDIF